MRWVSCYLRHYDALRTKIDIRFPYQIRQINATFIDIHYAKLQNMVKVYMEKRQVPYCKIVLATRSLDTLY